MYTALERNRLYRIGSKVMQYMGREWPEDHPPLFRFLDVESDETVTFMIEQLTAFEKEAQLEYIGTSLT